MISCTKLSPVLALYVEMVCVTEKLALVCGHKNSFPTQNTVYIYCLRNSYERADTQNNCYKEDGVCCCTKPCNDRMVGIHLYHWHCPVGPYFVMSVHISLFLSNPLHFSSFSQCIPLICEPYALPPLVDNHRHRDAILELTQFMFIS